MTPQDEKRIRIVAVQGSVRDGNFTGKALALVLDELGKHSSYTVDLFDPAGMILPPPGASTPSADATRLQEAVQKATGVVFATPEYHGSFSSTLKLVIENLGFPSLLAGKPIALLGVAAGALGAIKSLEHLRSVCSHVGAIVLPGPVSVAGVQQVFDEKGRCLDAAIEKRIRRVATGLVDYIAGSICPRVALEEMARKPLQ
ncbi:MAG: NADPH-dependent FMN reductase [Acidobacteriota bacterium]